MLKFKEIGVFLKKPGRDPVGTQSGPNRAPIFAFLGTAFGQSGSSRAPIFEFLAPRLDLSGSSQNHRKTCKNTAKMLFFMNLAASRHWIPTGSRLDPDWAKAVPKNAKIGARLGPDGILIGKNPLPHLFFPSQTHPCPYFPFPRTSRAPIPPPSCTKTVKAVLSQTGVLQYIYIYMLSDISKITIISVNNNIIM